MTKEYKGEIERNASLGRRVSHVKVWLFGIWVRLVVRAAGIAVRVDPRRARQVGAITVWIIASLLFGALWAAITALVWLCMSLPKPWTIYPAVMVFCFASGGLYRRLMKASEME